MFATGHRRYGRAMREALRSVLDRSPFDVVAYTGPGTRIGLRSKRLQRRPLEKADPRQGRAGPFLLALSVLDRAARASSATHLLLLDADTVMVRDTDVSDVVEALGDCPLGMVEQTCVLGGPMDQAALRRFAFETMTPFFGPVPDGLTAEDLVYFNSGVVLGRREALAEVASWALAHMARAGPEHTAGTHMVGDQDYLQHWVNVRRPGSCRRLDWSWNHCEHWDASFPDPAARILHFSGFCHGPRRSTIRRMRLARRRGTAALAAAEGKAS